MSEDEVTYDDVKEYESLFTATPSFVLGGMIRTNADLVSKFESTVKSNIKNLDENQRKKLDIILNSDISKLQEVMAEAYKKTRKKQYKLLSEPKAEKFIEKNLAEIKKLI